MPLIIFTFYSVLPDPGQQSRLTRHVGTASELARLQQPWMLVFGSSSGQSISQVLAGSFLKKPAAQARSKSTGQVVHYNHATMSR